MSSLWRRRQCSQPPLVELKGVGGWNDGKMSALERKAGIAYSIQISNCYNKLWFIPAHAIETLKGALDAMPVKLFIDTNVDASIFLIVDKTTRICDLKEEICRKLQQTDPSLQDIDVVRLNTLFDASNPRRAKDNCFAIPDDYSLGDIADAPTAKLYAECSRVKGIKRKRSDDVQQSPAARQNHKDKPRQQISDWEPSPLKKKTKRPEKRLSEQQQQQRGKDKAMDGPVSNKKKQKMAKQKEKLNKIAEDAAQKKLPQAIDTRPAQALSMGADGDDEAEQQRKHEERRLKNSKNNEKKKRRRSGVGEPAAVGGPGAEGTITPELPVVPTAVEVAKAAPAAVQEEEPAKLSRSQKKREQKKLKLSKLAEKKALQEVQAHAAATDASGETDAGEAKPAKGVVSSPGSPAIDGAPIGTQEASHVPADEQLDDAVEDTVTDNDNDSDHAAAVEQKQGGKGVPPAAPAANGKDTSSDSDSESEKSKEKSIAPKSKKKGGSGSSSSSSSSDDDTSASSDSSDDDKDDANDSDDEKIVATQPSGRFDGTEGILTHLLKSAVSGKPGDAGKTSMEELKAMAQETEEGAAAAAAAAKSSESYQWQKSHVNYQADALVKLCRVMLRDAINADRAARGEPELPGATIYKDATRPDWWPLQNFTAKAFKRKDDAVLVYNAARKVLAAVHGVNLDAVASSAAAAKGGE